MKAESFLSHCEKVKTTGRGTWIACCPAHDDKNPSMTVRDLEDGRVLVHCFGGCSVGEILASVGLTFEALFPDKPLGSGGVYVKGVRRPFPAADVLEAIAFESLLVSTAAANIANGVDLSAEDRARLRVANQRIDEARRLALG